VGGLGAQPSSTAASSRVDDGVRRKVEGRARAGGDTGEDDGGAGYRRREARGGVRRAEGTYWNRGSSRSFL
jgi:hypothetical protein